MGCNDVITLYQVASEDFNGSNQDFAPSPTNIAKNLLESPESNGKLRIVSPTEFKPWYESGELISLSFKFPPPKSSLQECNSTAKLNPSIENEKQYLSGETKLPEFFPVYSGNSCLTFRQHSCSSMENAAVREMCEEEKQCLHEPHKGSKCSWSEGLGERREKNQTSEATFNATDKSFYLWCISPPFSSHGRKSKDFKLENHGEINLQQVKSQFSLRDHHRGKWILSEKSEGSRGKHQGIKFFWKKICCLIQEGFLPHCNAKFQKHAKELWLYCDFAHSLKVRSVLENGLGRIGILSFYVHPAGVVLKL